MTGKPMDRRRRKVRIPIGIEKVLCVASADREFREQLLMARADALAGTGLEISDAEAMILKSVSEDALRTMIESIDLKRHRKRRFFRGIAAASLVATTATVSTQCVFDSGGAHTDMPEDTEIPQDTVETVDGYGEDGMLSDEFSPPADVTPSDTMDITTGVDTQDIDVEDVQVYAGIPPMDVNELDVDVQPMPAGIPPMDVIDE